MKRYFIFAIFYSLLCSAPCYTIVHDQCIVHTHDTELSATTKAILHRYYLVARLKKNIVVLQEIEKRLTIPYHDLLMHATSYFTHHEVRQALQEMCAQKSCAPLWKLWHDIQAYKKLYDADFAHDFARLLLYIKHTVLHTALSPHKNININNIDTVDIAYRFYLVNRLEAVFQQLHALKDSALHMSVSTPHNFKHKQITQCIDMLNKENNNEPLCQLIEEFADFKHCHDTTFTHEFLILICMLCKDVQTKTPHAPTNADIIRQEFHASNNQFTNYVFRRYYYINRLQSIIQVLQSFDASRQQNSSIVDHGILFSFHSLPFQHGLIKQCIGAVKQAQSFKPLFALWNDFVHYHHIDDELFTEEFIKNIFVIMRNSILCLQTVPSKEQEHLFLDFLSSITLQACALLDVVDTYAALMVHYNPQFMVALDAEPANIEPQSAEKSGEPLQESVHADEVMERFYHIQRLAKHQRLLKKAFLCNVPVTFDATVAQFFSHPKIIACISEISHEATLDPLVKLGHDIERYKYIQDPHFMREFLGLVYVSYATLYEQSFTRKTPLSFFQTLEALPLEEILHAIDILSKELPTIIEKYELKSSMTWKQWLKKYWWVPPLTATTITLKILIALKFLKHKGLVG